MLVSVKVPQASLAWLPVGTAWTVKVLVVGLPTKLMLYLAVPLLGLCTAGRTTDPADPRDQADAQLASVRW